MGHHGLNISISLFLYISSLPKEECLIDTHIQWIGIWCLVLLVVSFLNYKNTMVNFSFARMRKKYIEDNESEDPALIAKVAPHYQRTSQIISGTQLSFVISSALVGISILALDSHVSLLLAVYLPGPWDWVRYVILGVLSLVIVMAYWVGTILIPAARALASPLAVLASHTWVISWNRHLYRLLVELGLWGTRKLFARWKMPFVNEVNFTYTEDEIRCIVEESHRSGRLSTLENTLIKNAFDFFDLLARDVMIPRNVMAVLDFEDDVETMCRTISKTRHSCYPVCMEDKDQVLGFIQVKDLMESCLLGSKSVKQILREVLTVPEVMPAPALLQLMKNRRIYLAVVVDEYGCTSGLVTLEDLVEELIGEIPQEQDNVPYEIVRQKNGVYEFDGTVIVEDVADRLQIDFGDENKNATIGGFVFSRLERVPKAGDEIEFEGWHFTVLRVSGFRIVRVKAEKEA